MTKIMWHSNVPWAPTGYGAQTALFAPLIAEEHEFAISSFYGLEGAPIRWEGITVFPGLGNDFGDVSLPQHVQRFFAGDMKGGLVMTLMDVWPLNPERLRGMNLACWCPVDHQPAPPKVVEFFMQTGAVPIAMTRFGQEQLGRLDPMYVPHGVDTQIFQPMDKIQSRNQSFPDDAFVVGMVAANKGRPSRKSFSQALQAFARFAAVHDDAYIYLHTVFDPNVGGGESIPALLRELDIPEDRIRAGDQYTLMYSPYNPPDMAKIYNALDVLLSPSMGEGFGIPIVEAQACGIPVIVTDWTAMPEVMGAGWKVDSDPYWTGLNSWQRTPRVDDIVSALEECYSLRKSQRQKMAIAARKHAMQYDVHRVWQQHMRPAIRTIIDRFEKRTPVRIPARKLKAVA